jgi:hypothetical protein
MKSVTLNLIISVLIATTVVGCGTELSELSQGSNLAARHQTTIDTVIENVSVRPVSGGFNPNFVAWQVEGRVQTGSNRCHSQGVNVQVTQEKIGDELHVTLKLRRPQNIGERICTREFMPQYKDVKFDVRYDSTRITRAVLHNVEIFDRDIEVGSMAVLSEAVVVSNVTIEPLMTTMHSSRTAFRISGDVESGSNPCFASLSQTAFESRKVGKTVQLVAIRKNTHTDQMCTMEYNPQTSRISIDVEFGLGEVEGIEILNVDEIGESLSQILSPSTL